jgi:hypothetical protein
MYIVIMDRVGFAHLFVVLLVVILFSSLIIYRKERMLHSLETKRKYRRFGPVGVLYEFLKDAFGREE